VEKEHKASAESGLKVEAVLPLQSLYLERYVHTRHIPLELAKQYCHEVHFWLNETLYKAIGFKNDLGGYELRNDWFKGSCAPKAVTLFKKSVERLCVFEGFFDFLSFRRLFRDGQFNNSSCLVLNSLSFLKKSEQQMTPFKEVYLFLDQDPAGRLQTQKLLDCSMRFIDGSNLYQGYKDLNEWTCSIGKKQKNGPRQKW
jgi:hypothetical protein